MSVHRKGFTLVELLVVTVLGSLVLLAAMQVLITNRRAYTSQNEAIQGQQTNRMAIEVLFNELREVSPPGGDILAMASDSLRVRLMRKFSYVCDFSISGSDAIFTAPRVFVTNSGDSLKIMDGTNHFAVGDSVFVFADNDPDITTDDVWVAGSVTAWDSVLAACPHALLEPAIAVTFGGQEPAFTADSVGLGAPMRSYEEFTFGTTVMNGDTYLARRDTGAYVPIAGPITSSNGLEFVYRDATGTVTATPADVAQIQVTVRTGNTVLNSTGQMVQDSVLVWIYTRN